MKRLFFILISLGIALSVRAQQVQLPEGYTSQVDVVYVKAGEWEGRMDLYLPPKTGKPTPVVVNIHGGGFTHGSKESQTGFESFFKLGFAVANISYRLAKVAPAPAAIEDARCAVAYLVKNAAALNIDTSRIVTRGGSAGGHLALMAGLLSRGDIFAKNCPNTHVRVAAIVENSGPTDLTKWEAMKKENKASRAWLGGRENDMDFVAGLSPINYVSKNSPPVFIAHGNADRTVPYEQSVLLADKLKAEGVYVDFYTLENVGHAFSTDNRKAVNEAMEEFLKKVLNL